MQERLHLLKVSDVRHDKSPVAIDEHTKLDGGISLSSCHLLSRFLACRARALLIASLQVASLLLFLGPPWSSRCSDATMAFGCVCSTHVSGWLTSVEVFAVIPLGLSCFLSALERWSAQAGCFIAHSDASGRRVMRARLVFWRSGASSMGANAVDWNSTFFGVFKIKACALFAVKGLNTRNQKSLNTPQPHPPHNKLQFSLCVSGLFVCAFSTLSENCAGQAARVDAPLAPTRSLPELARLRGRFSQPSSSCLHHHRTHFAKRTHSKKVSSKHSYKLYTIVTGAGDIVQLLVRLLMTRERTPLFTSAQTFALETHQASVCNSRARNGRCSAARGPALT